jgi:signal transduction histidine kinase
MVRENGVPEQIGAHEAARLKERFVTRSVAVFYARMAFLALGVGILAIPSWRSAFGAGGKGAVVGFGAVFAYSVAAFFLAAHPRHGRRAMFITLIFDLGVLLTIIANSGGLTSPAMGAQLLFTIFFALLFPNPIAIVPPLAMLPLVVQVGHHTAPSIPLSVELLLLLWYAALNGIAVYVIVYLTSREELQSREIAKLQRELRGLAVVEERNRLAREIHDGTGAALSGLIIQAEYLLTLARGNETLREEIIELKGAAEEAIDEVRRALSMMRDEFDLVPQIQNTCTTFTTRHRLPVELTITGEPPNFSDSQQLNVFRIMQECLTNVAKHAEAKTVTVEVNFAGRDMRMEIQDDGRGFDPEKTPKHHYGVLNMHERAKKARGKVAIESSPGSGTRITLRVQAPETPSLAPAPPNMG